MKPCLPWIRSIDAVTKMVSTKRPDRCDRQQSRRDRFLASLLSLSTLLLNPTVLRYSLFASSTLVGLTARTDRVQAQATCPLQSQLNNPLNLTFGAPTYISGTAGAAGAVYRYSNVATGVDAILTIETYQGTNIVTGSSSVPLSSGLGGSVRANPDATYQYKIVLVNSGTTTPIPPQNLVVTAFDIDGNPGNTVTDFASYVNPNGYFVNSPTKLLSTVTATGIEFTNTDTGVNDTTNSPQYAAGAFYFNTNSFRLSAGLRNASAPATRGVQFNFQPTQLNNFTSLNCATFPRTSVLIYGNVFNDTDGSKIQNGTESAFTAGGLNAVLVGSNNKVIATTPIAADGSYTFNDVPANANYTVEITTNSATVGSAPPAVTLPTGWTTTGENLNGAIDGTADSKISVPVTTANVVGANFGIQTTPPSPAPSSVCSAAGGTLGANLFANNGSFGTGSSTPGTTGASLPTGRTTYTPVNYSGGAPNDGEYSIVNQLNQTTFNYWFNPVFGHTTGTVTDQMMVVNASFTPGTFYTETLTVPANQTMDFGFWILNLPSPSSGGWTAYGGGTAGNPNASGTNIKPDISLVINRIGVDDNNDGIIDEPGEGQVIATTGAIPFTSSPTWVRYGALWNSGNSTQVEFRFVNNAPGGAGNDLALDDLINAPCTLPSGNISGTLYRDQNGNNTYNSGTESTMPANIAVDLKNSTGGIVATAYTNASGAYNFTNVPAGSSYTIQVALTDPDIPSGATATANPSGANTTGSQTGITVTAGTTLANQNFGFSALPVSVSGTVFEDPNYGGGAGRPLSTSATSPRSSATVELYKKSDGSFISSTTTSSAPGTVGQYTFNNVAPGDYFVRVVNSTVTSSRGTGSILPVQTFRVDDSTGTVADDPNRVGGEKPSVADTGAAATGAILNTTNFTFTTGAGTATTGGQAESIAPVKVGSTAVTGIDFGYNFDTIVNTNDSGQGSLRQFITNSNALTNTGLAQSGQTAGAEVSIFMISDGLAHAGLRAGLANQLSSGVGVISPTSLLPIVTDAYTIVDGRTQTTNIGNLNAAILGIGGTVGTGNDGRSGTGDEVSLSQVAAPEIEIRDGNNLSVGLEIGANNVSVAGIAIHGFGSNTVTEDIRVQGVQNILITQNFIGSTAANFANPTAAERTGGNGIRLLDGAQINITNNLIGFVNQNGISGNFATTGANVTITNNELRSNSASSTTANAIELFWGSPVNPTISIQGNLIIDNINQGGIHLNRQTGTSTGKTITIQNNTIAHAYTSSAGQFVQGILYDSVQDTIISQNIISDTTSNRLDGAGIALKGSSQRNQITKNSIYGTVNGLGIDINPSSTGPNVTANDGAKTALSNNGMDYPVINFSGLSSGTLTVKGFVGNNPAGSATFANAILEFFVADNSPADQNGEVIQGDGKSKPHGEGRTYIGTCTADANGLFGTVSNPCSFSNVPASLTNANNITATATDAAGNTSEFSAVPSVKANILMVKRITAINGDRTKNPNDNTPLNAFVDNTTTTADNDPNWPSNYLLGESTAGKVKPGDEIEYTIYYLNQGENSANLVKICDLLAPNLVFNPSGFGSGIGFQLKLGTSPVQSLTSANDPTLDRAQYINAPFVSLSGCNSPINTANASGAVVLDLNSASAIDPSVPTNLLTIPGATSSSPIPNNSYGSLRFKAKVK